MRITINLATRGYINARRFNVGAAITAGILVVICALAANRLAVNHQEILALEGQLQKGAANDNQVSTQEYQAVLAKIKFANGIIEQKTFNWLGLLDHLERVVPDGVALSAVQPDLGKNQLKLTGAARSFTNLRKFMEALEDSSTFRNVYLLGQGAAKGGNDAGISFSISCDVEFKSL